MDIRARVATFHLAGRAAAITTDGVTVVAFLGRDDQPVTTLGRAARAGCARWFKVASRIAAVTRDQVPVVAALGPFLDAVSTGRFVACVFRSRAGASPPSLPLASRAAAIAIGRVAVVTLLGAGHDPIAAFDDTRSAGVGADIASFHLRAVSRATVATHGVAVVARFRAADDSVPALYRVHAGRARRRTGPTGFDQLTVRRTAIAVHSVAVVANLPDRDVHIAVSATGGARTRLARGQTNPARLGLTRARAAVPRGRVAVVAGLTAGDAAVATNVEFGTRFSRCRAGISGILTQAVRTASVAGGGIAIVADLARIEYPIAANIKGYAGLTRSGTGIAGFDLAQAVAAVSGKGIAVVASLRGLIDQSIATGWLRCDRAAALGRTVGAPRATSGINLEAIVGSPGRTRFCPACARSGSCRGTGI